MAQLPEAGRRLLDTAPYAHLATLMPDGWPKAEPVWVGRDGEMVLVATDAKSIKARNVVADDRVALSIVAIDDPYEQLLIRGRVVEIRDDDDLVTLDELSVRYTGVAFPRRRWSSRIVLAIAPDVARHYRSALSDPRLAREENPT